MELIAIGIVKKGDKFLVGKVKTSNLEEYGGIKYIFPGGYVEAGETPEQAVKRELYGKTGIQIESAKLISQRMHPVTGLKSLYFHCDVMPEARPDVSKLSLPDTDISIFLWVESDKIKGMMPTLNPEVAEYFSLK